MSSVDYVNHVLEVALINAEQVVATAKSDLELVEMQVSSAKKNLEENQSKVAQLKEHLNNYQASKND